MNLTKMNMAKVIVTALYNLPKLVTEENIQPFAHARKLTKWKKDDLVPQYKLAMKILEKR